MRWFLALAKFVGLHTWRAWTWDLRSVAPTPGEAARLTAAGIDDEPARQYLVWRKSTLLVAALLTLASAVIYSAVALGVYLDQPRLWSRFGVVVQTVRHAALFAAPVASFAALLLWRRLRLSRLSLLAGWMIAFLVPVGLSLIPPHRLFDWAGGIEISQEALQGLANELDLPVTLDVEGVQVPRIAHRVVDLVGCVVYGGLLLQTAVSLIGGVLRGCLRLKVCLPESVLPGWSLLMVSSLYFLAFLVALVVLNQVTADWRMLVSVLLFAAAPLVYLAAAPLVLRPTRHDLSRKPFRAVQTAYGLMIAAAVALLCVYLSTIEIPLGDTRYQVFGLSDTAMIGPLGFLQFAVDYLGRSFFMTVVMADLVLRAHALVWHHSASFARSADGAEYDSRMARLSQLVGKTGEPACRADSK